MEDKQKNTKQKLLSKIPVLSVAGLLSGALGGYIYYLEIGCVSGTCAITSNPWMSTLWGAAFGYLVFDMFKAKKRAKQSDEPA